MAQIKYQVNSEVTYTLRSLGTYTLRRACAGFMETNAADNDESVTGKRDETIETPFWQSSGPRTYGIRAVVCAFLVGMLLSAIPLGIALGAQYHELSSHEILVPAPSPPRQPEYDWSFEGVCLQFNASKWGPNGYDPMAFSFEFFAHPPFRGIAVSNSATYAEARALEVDSENFFKYINGAGWNGLLHITAKAHDVPTMVPFTTVLEAGDCAVPPGGSHPTISWTCATMTVRALLGNEHIQVYDQLGSAETNCSLFLDLHTPGL